MKPNYDAIIEGVCPVHGTPLERRDTQGWCATCNVGYSIRPDSVAIDVSEIIDTVEIDGGLSHGAVLRWVVPRQAS